MSQTIIGVFSNIDQAEDAKSYLLSNGFSTEDVNININAATDSINDGKTDQKVMSDDIINSMDNDGTNTPLVAAQKGVIVTVHTKNSDEALEASEVMINYGALNLNDLV